MEARRYLSLAWRNLGRNRRRTIVTGLAIAMGLGMFIMIVSLEDGAYRGMIRTGVSQIAGHVVVQAQGYHDDPRVDATVPATLETLALVRRAVPEAPVVPRVFVQGLLSSPASASGVELFGIEPEAEAAVNDLSDQLVEGEWVATDQDVVIGHLLAENLDVRLGDRVVLMAQHRGEIESWLFRVSGIFRTGMDEMDGFFALAHIEAVQQMLALGDGVHQISVHLPNPHRTDRVTAELSSVLGDRAVEVLPWPVVLREFYELMVFDKAGTMIFLILLAFIVGLGILNTVLMSVLERMREFGVLLSLGLSPGRLAILVLTEAALLGLVGVVLGVGVGLLGVWPMATIGIDFGALIGEGFDAGGLAMGTVIYAYAYPGKVVTFAIAGVLITLLAAIHPAIKAARLQPIEAMHQH
jgi:ABC-type lipoprotein release transport system permease subunit